MKGDITLDDKKFPLVFGTGEALDGLDINKLRLPAGVKSYELHFQPAEYATIEIVHSDGRKTLHFLGRTEDGRFEPAHEIKEKA